MTRFVWAILFIVSLSAATSLAAASPTPYRTRTNHPLRLGAYDPIPSSTNPSGDGRWLLSADFEYASVYFAATSDDNTQTAIFDFELAKLSIGGVYAFEQSPFALSAQLGLYHFSKGFLDDFLEGYHDIFGLPNSGREDRPHNDFASEIRDLGGNLLLGGESGGVRIGSLALAGMHRHQESTTWAGGELNFAERFGISIPIGDDSALLDAGFEVSAGVIASLAGDGWSVDGNLDVTLPLEKTPYDHDSVRSLFWGKLMLTGAYEFWSGVWGRAQFVVASPRRESDAGHFHVDEWNALGTFGAQIELDESKLLSIALVEDLNPGVDADFSVLFALDWRF